MGDVIFVSRQSLGTDDIVAQSALDEGYAPSSDKLVGDEARCTTGGKEKEETGVVIASREAGEVEEAEELANLGHASETKTKNENRSCKYGGDDLETIKRSVFIRVFLLVLLLLLLTLSF